MGTTCYEQKQSAVEDDRQYRTIETGRLGEEGGGEEGRGVWQGRRASVGQYERPKDEASNPREITQDLKIIAFESLLWQRLRTTLCFLPQETEHARSPET